MNVTIRDITPIHMLRLSESESLAPATRCTVEIVRRLEGEAEKVMATGYGATFLEAMSEMEHYWANLFNATRGTLAAALMELEQDREEAARG